jgi:hypothetical protein
MYPSISLMLPLTSVRAVLHEGLLKEYEMMDRVSSNKRSKSGLRPKPEQASVQSDLLPDVHH